MATWAEMIDEYPEETRKNGLIWLFSNSSDGCGWMESNCEACIKYRDPEEEQVCDMIAAIASNTVSNKVFKRMGERTGRCTEHQNEAAMKKELRRLYAIRQNDMFPQVRGHNE